MANGPGVSIAELPDGRWRVRWRETVVEDGTTRRPQRERVVRDEATAIQLRARVLRDLEEGRIFEEEVEVVGPVATVDEIVVGWVRARGARGMRRGTLRRNVSETAMLLSILRDLRQIPADRPVSAVHLTRAAVIEVTAALRKRKKQRGGGTFADGTIYSLVSTLLAMWVWAADDPVTYPGLHPPPRDLQAVKPRPPEYEAPEAPTLAEADAVIRQVKKMARTGNVAVPVAVIARWTGLRASSIMHLQPDDVNLRAATLRIRSGKTKAARKTLPIALGLRDYLVPLVARALEEERPWLLRRNRGVGDPPTGGGPDATLARAWAAAVAAGEARQEVWSPESRKNARPEHAFRAAFQDHLVRAGVRDEVIDLLVGHAPRTTRAKHYVTESARMDAMRAALALLPPIDWQTPKRGTVHHLPPR